MHHISWSGTEQPVVVRGGGQDAASFKRWTLSAPSRASYVGYTFFWFASEVAFYFTHPVNLLCFLPEGSTLLFQLFSSCSWFYFAWSAWKTRPSLFTQSPALFILYLLSSVYMSCWMLRLLQWYSTCPCCEMIHLQVCLSASQASSHSFSPPLPQMSKSASFTQASKTLPFLPYDFASQGGVCLSLWIPTKQALMASLCITWVNYTLLRKICMLCSAMPW